MTTEEKAKAYDNALKRIREFYLEYDNISNLIDVKRELESIFPQLCESEDEQTRRRLIEFISDIKEISESGRNSWAIRKEDVEMCNAFLSYLEKQKEQKSKFNVGDTIRLKNSYAEYTIESISDGRYYCKGCSIDIDGCDRDYELVRQKPAEWSEEDDWKRKELIQYLEEKGDYRTVWMTWLESLRPQSQGEIYQAAKHDLAIKFMNYLDENRPEEKMSLSNGECKDIDKAFKEGDWAKIIRYIKKYQPHWKPSKEEMEALDVACSGKLWYGDIYLEGLKRIREQLKKQM